MDCERSIAPAVLEDAVDFVQQQHDSVHLGQRQLDIAGAKGLMGDDIVPGQPEDEHGAVGIHLKQTAVTLSGADGAVRTLLLGIEDANGDRYARLPDSRMVYTFAGSDVDGILAASIDTRHGLVSAKWTRTASGWRFDIVTPVETEIVLPNEQRTVPAGSYVFHCDAL